MNGSIVANTILALAEEFSISFKFIKLLQLVYICHGYSLSIRGEGLLNPDYERVEAWQFGPVIPSLYHEFKHFGKEDIDKSFKSEIVTTNSRGEPTVEKPQPFSKDSNGEDLVIYKIILTVFERYKDKETFEIIDSFHGLGNTWLHIFNLFNNKKTPWSQVYNPYNRYLVIEDSLTKAYYREEFKEVLKEAGIR